MANNGHFKCCKDKELTSMVCVSCFGLFHRSCTGRKSIIVVDNHMILCSKECEEKYEKSNEVENLAKEEINHLREELRQKDEYIKREKRKSQAFENDAIDIEDRYTNEITELKNIVQIKDNELETERGKWVNDIRTYKEEIQTLKDENNELSYRINRINLNNSSLQAANKKLETKLRSQSKDGKQIIEVKTPGELSEEYKAAIIELIDNSVEKRLISIESRINNAMNDMINSVVSHNSSIRENNRIHKMEDIIKSPKNMVNRKQKSGVKALSPAVRSDNFEINLASLDKGNELSIQNRAKGQVNTRDTVTAFRPPKATTYAAITATQVSEAVINAQHGSNNIPNKINEHSHQDRKGRTPSRNNRGTAMVSEEEPFKSAPRKMWLYIGKVNENVNNDMIEQFIKSKACISNDNQLRVEQLETLGRTKAFKIGVDVKFYNLINVPEFWPDGIVFRRFNFRKNVSESNVNQTRIQVGNNQVNKEPSQNHFLEV